MLFILFIWIIFCEEWLEEMLVDIVVWGNERWWVKCCFWEGIDVGRYMFMFWFILVLVIKFVFMFCDIL